MMRKQAQWTHAIQFRAAGTAFNGQRNSESYSADTMVRYNLTEHRYLFFAISYFDDKFDSFNRSASIAAGFGFKALLTDKLNWDLYSGLRYSDQSRKQTNEDISGMTFLGVSRYTHQFTPTTDFEFFTRVEINL